MDNLKRDFSVGSNPDETNFLQFQGLKNFLSHKSEQISNHVSSKKSQRCVSKCLDGCSRFDYGKSRNI